MTMITVPLMGLLGLILGLFTAGVAGAVSKDAAREYFSHVGMCVGSICVDDVWVRGIS